MNESLRDIRVIAMLSAEEFIAFKAVCAEMGYSQSSMLRGLIKRAIRDFAIECREADRNDSDGPAQEK